MSPSIAKTVRVKVQLQDRVRAHGRSLSIIVLESATHGLEGHDERKRLARFVTCRETSSRTSCTPWIVPGWRRRYKYSNCAVFSREPKVYKASSRLDSHCRRDEDQNPSNPGSFGASSSTGVAKLSCYRVLETRVLMGQIRSMLCRI